MNEDYTYKIVEDEVKDDDVVMVVNDYYVNSDFCDYVAPNHSNYTGPAINIVKEEKQEDPKTVFHEVNYSL